VQPKRVGCRLAKGAKKAGELISAGAALCEELSGRERTPENLPAAEGELREKIFFSRPAVREDRVIYNLHQNTYACATGTPVGTGLAGEFDGPKGRLGRKTRSLDRRSATLILHASTQFR